MVEENTSSLEAAFGANFLAQYKDIQAKKRQKKLPWNETTKEDIIHLVKQKGEDFAKSPQLMYSYNGEDYHVILVETPAKQGQLIVRPAKYQQVQLSFIWNGKWLSAFIPETELVNYAPKEHYILVGIINVKEVGIPPQIKKFYNIKIHGMISMAEIVAYSEKLRTEDKATTEAISLAKDWGKPEDNLSIEGYKLGEIE